jgi:hypothetical protein
MSYVKDIQKLYETTVLIGKSKALEESRGGWMVGLVGDLEEAFNTDAGFYNGKYPSKDQTDAPGAQARMLEPKQHKAMVNALHALIKTMQKGYKGKLIGF